MDAMRSCILCGLLFFPAFVVGLCSTTIDFSLEYFKHRDMKVMCLLTCEKDHWINNFIKKASKHWLSVVVVKTTDLLDSTKVESCLQQKYSSVGVLADTSCPGFDLVVNSASKNILMDSTHKWLIIVDESYLNVLNSDTNNTLFDTEQRNMTEVVNVFDELNLSVDADILLAMKEEDEQYKLYDMYNFGKEQGGGLIIEQSAFWTCGTGFSRNLNEYKYYKRWNFQQWPMKMITVFASGPKEFDPKMLTDLNSTPQIATITKTSYTVLKVISDIHNVRTRYYYRIPTYGAGKLENQFLRPFSTGAWISVVVVTGMCALVLLLSAKVEKRPSSGQYAIFSVVATICQQFFDENTIGIERVCGARKITILVTGISCVLIYNYYTSSVVSWLLNGPPPSINSLQELLESPLELIFEDIGYTRSWLQTPLYYFNKRNADIEDELRKKKVLNKKKDAPLLIDMEQGIRMVKAGGYAFHTEVENANRLISRTFTQSELCELGSLQSMEKTLLYPCLQKNSPYKEFLVWSLMRLLERGIVKCIQHRTMSPTVRCEGSSPRALALGGAAPAFLLLAGGFALATLIMLAERFIWNYQTQKSLVFIKREKSRRLYLPNMQKEHRVISKNINKFKKSHCNLVSTSNECSNPHDKLT